MSSVTGSSFLEEQMKTLQKHFGAIVSTVKHLKSEIKDLKGKFENNKLNEVREIIEAQRVKLWLPTRMLLIKLKLKSFS